MVKKELIRNTFKHTHRPDIMSAANKVQSYSSTLDAETDECRNNFPYCERPLNE